SHQHKHPSAHDHRPRADPEERGQRGAPGSGRSLRRLEPLYKGWQADVHLQLARSTAVHGGRPAGGARREVDHPLRVRLRRWRGRQGRHRHALRQRQEGRHGPDRPDPVLRFLGGRRRRRGRGRGHAGHRSLQGALQVHRQERQRHDRAERREDRGSRGGGASPQGGQAEEGAGGLCTGFFEAYGTASFAENRNALSMRGGNAMTNTRRGLPVLVALFTVVAVMVAPAVAQPKPNIVVIMGDDIGIWNIGAYHRGMMAGKTPNLDKIAAEGMLFTDYYAEASCTRSEEHTSELQSPDHLVCRLLLEKKNNIRKLT